MNIDPLQNHRVLVIDDNRSIHDDFCKILSTSGAEAQNSVEDALFGETTAPLLQLPTFDIDSAYQGQEGVDFIVKSLQESRPYAMAFVDVRMPPGMDGIETTGKIWEKYPDLQVVICTAYSDYSWDETLQKLGYSDRLVILKKPFDNIEVLQLAISLTEKWRLHQQAKLRLVDLEQMVQERTRDLETANTSLAMANHEMTRANGRLAQEMKTRLQMEVELRQAQKLESVGRLASGIAHEINTPVQFVGDSIHFLREATNDLIGVIAKLKVVQQSVVSGSPSIEAANEAAAAEAQADLPYLLAHVPKAFDCSMDGLHRVTTIIRSMKEFAYPDAKEMTAVDLNRAIENTLIIARNEYKYISEVETHFGELPNVTCYASDFNQVILNLLVNAAHAIEDVVKGTDHKGLITIRTSLDGDDAVISVTDTGCGIPEDIREKIFDPFFTTKKIGRGTGQGLSIAHSVIVDKHKGQLYAESTVGQGTTFFIRLPVKGPLAASPQAAP